MIRSIVEGDEVMLEDIRAATGSAYCYSYVELPRQADVKKIKKQCAITRRLFAPLAKSFDENANSRWVLRHYLAIKFATAANLLAGSAAYAHEHNLLMGVPYFNYYAALNACRAYLLASPHVIWGGSKTIKMTHSNILNRTAEYLRALDPIRAPMWGRQLEALREWRELFSYRFPLSGPHLTGDEAFDPDRPVALARLIAELASLNSECLDGSLCKHTSEEFHVRSLPDHDWASAYELAGIATEDPADRYRFSKFVSKWRKVAPLEVMCSDGLMDDVYTAWSDAHDRPGAFNPDACSRLVLSL